MRIWVCAIGLPMVGGEDVLQFRRRFRRSSGWNHTRRRNHGALRRTIVVHHREGKPNRGVAMQRFAPGEQISQRRPGRPALGQHGFGENGRNKGHGNAFLYQPIPQQIRRRAGLFIHQHQGCPRGQIRPYLPHGGVKADSRNVARPIAGRDSESIPMPEDEIQKIAVRNLDALGLSGGSRGVDDIGQLVACHRHRLGQSNAALNRASGRAEIDHVSPGSGHQVAVRAA